MNCEYYVIEENVWDIALSLNLDGKATLKLDKAILKLIDKAIKKRKKKEKR